jgi:hypothetical protein
MSRRVLVAVVALAAACAGEPTTPTKAEVTDLRSGGSGCRHDGDCAPGQTCFQAMCTSLPEPPSGVAPTGVASLEAAPASLSFGTVAVAAEKRLAIALTNDGEAMVTLEGVQITPSTSPFRLEPLGAGPFWIRPERSREIFVTYAPTTPGPHGATLRITSQAPAVSVNLSGN